MAAQLTAVVLAAGGSSRFGGQKLLSPYRGRPLLVWSLEVVETLPLAERIIVLGAGAAEILARIFSSSEEELATFNSQGKVLLSRSGKGWLAVYNRDWPAGMGTSLAQAAALAKGGLLVFLGDMPRVSRKAALAVLARAGARPVAPSYRGQRGFPVYLPASLKPRLAMLRADYGARQLLAEDCELVPWDDGGVVFDIDRPDDLAAASPGQGAGLLRGRA